MTSSVLSILLATLVVLAIPTPSHLPSLLVLAGDTPTKPTRGSFPAYGIGIILVYEFNQSWASYPPCSSLTPPAGCLTSAGQFAWSYCGSYASHGNGTISAQMNQNNNTRLDVYYDKELQNYFLGTTDVFEDAEEDEGKGPGASTAAVWRLFGENDDEVCTPTKAGILTRKSIDVQGEVPLLISEREQIPPDFLVTELPASPSRPGRRRTAGPLWYLDRAQDNEFDLAAIQTKTHSVGVFGLCFIRFDDGDED
ncbi:hypothetical protein BJX61DRAFT_540191 [Aspergillus egyptiacus]|nr:hypothetical protein BJX61DRAFT_540191 [Aspergillus egyptiacus]